MCVFGLLFLHCVEQCEKGLILALESRDTVTADVIL